MSSSLFRLVLLIAVLWSGFLAHPAQAQQQAPKLPDISPREIEIRGEGDVALPSLKRQPIRALAPPPSLLNRPSRLPRVIPDTLAAVRLPPPSAELSIAPAGRADSPQATPHGALEATAGRYWSRSLRGRVTWPFNQQTHLNASLTYEGLEGNHPYSATSLDPKSSSDVFEGQTALTIGMSDWEITPKIGGLLTDYTLYGLAAPGMANAYSNVPERHGLHSYAAVEVKGLRTRQADLRATLAYRGSRYDTELLRSDPERKEQWLTGQFSALAPLPFAKWKVHARAATAGLDGNSFSSSDRAVFDAGTELRFQWSQINLNVGLRSLNYQDAPVSNGKATDGAWQSFIAPSAHLQIETNAGLQLYAQNKPELTPNRLLTVFQTNPYLINQPFLSATVHTIDAEAGLRWKSTPLQLTFFGGYVHAPQEQYFTRSANTNGYSAVRYGEANILQGGARLNLAVLNNVQLSLSGKARRGRLTASDQPIPYFAPFVGDLSALYFFGRGELEASGELVSSRPLNIAGSNEIGPFAKLDLSARYQVAPPFGVVLHLKNALPGSLERWYGYPRPALVASVGFRAIW